MAESMPGGLNMDNLSSGSSSLDKRRNIDLNGVDGHSDEHGTHACTCVCYACVCACVRICVCVIVYVTYLLYGIMFP